MYQWLLLLFKVKCNAVLVCVYSSIWSPLAICPQLTFLFPPHATPHILAFSWFCIISPSSLHPGCLWPGKFCTQTSIMLSLSCPNCQSACHLLNSYISLFEYPVFFILSVQIISTEREIIFKVYERGICGCISKILLEWVNNQSLFIYWNNFNCIP